MKLKKGFTIVELTITMAFLAILLVAIALITIYAGSIYQKGLTIRTVNSVGQLIIDDINRSANAAPIKSLSSLCRDGVGVGGDETTPCRQDGAFVYIYHQQYLDGVTVDKKEGPKRLPTSGVFCSGRYSYIWNTGYVLGDKYGVTNEDKQRLRDRRAIVEYTVKEGGAKGTMSNFRLLRMRDDEGNLCYNAAGYSGNTSNRYTVEVESQPVELIEPSEYNVVIYDMVVFKPTQHFLTLHSYYAGSFILGTQDGTIDITAPGDYCREMPDNLNTDFNYCMVNKFNFATRATGELTDEEKADQ